MKGFFYKTYKRLLAVRERIKSAFKRKNSNGANEMPTYKHCLNCGTELVGMYCHKCGQYASPPTINMSEFIKDYFRNLFSIENQSIPTLLSLMFRPGKVAKEFSAGRHVSYIHPLKLNFFILVVLITIFSLVGADSKVKDSFGKLTDQEMFVSDIALSSVMQDTDNLPKFEASPRDTVKLVSSQVILKKYPNLVDIIEVIGENKEKGVDTLIVSIPTLFIEDKLVVENEGVYHFESNEENDYWHIIAKMESLWEKAFSLIFAHFPLFMLLTTSFFVYSLRLLLRKRNCTMSNMYIFSLYYIAFVEVVLTILFLCCITFGLSFNDVEWILILSVISYLAAALRKVYDIKSWLLAFFYAITVNVLYLITTFSIILIVSFISIVVMVLS